VESAVIAPVESSSEALVKAPVGPKVDTPICHVEPASLDSTRCR